MTGQRTSLLGAWQITQRVAAGEDALEPGDEPRFLWFLSDHIVTGDQWAAWNMPYSTAGAPTHGTLDVTRADQRDPWVEPGIYALDSGTLRLCMAGHPMSKRPTEFASTPENGWTLYVLVPSDEAVPA